MISVKRESSDEPMRVMVCSSADHVIPVAATTVVSRLWGPPWAKCAGHTPRSWSCEACGVAADGESILLAQYGSSIYCLACHGERTAAGPLTR